MDSFEINKVVAAILLVALLIIGIGKLSDIIFYVEKPETPGYAVEVEQISTNTMQSTSGEIEEKIDIAALMAMGDIATGEKVFKKCAACHSIIKGGKNNIGPALYNVVGRKIGDVNDYKYSKAMAAYDKTWTFEDTSKNNFKLILKYFFVYGISLFFAVLTVNFTIIIFNLPEYIAVIMSIIVSTILNYLGLRNWVFSETYDSKR